MSSGAQRYAVCVASYGYMGDLMRTSERLRFLGPARYGLAGAWTLLRGAAYDAEVCRHNRAFVLRPVLRMRWV